MITRQSKKDELWEEVERLRQAQGEERNRSALLEDEAKRLRRENARLEELNTFNQELKQRVQAANESLEILTSLTKELASFDLDGVLEVSVQRIPYLVGARYASVYLYDRKHDQLLLKQHTHGRDIDRVVDLTAAPNSLMATAVRTQKTLCIGDLGGFLTGEGQSVSRPHQENYETNSCVVAPLLAAGEVEGILNLADRFDRRPFSESTQLKLIKQACELVAVSLRNARLFDEVQRAARQCSLTGLRNSQAFSEILETEVRRAKRYDNALAVLAFKVHGVGLINANYGHQAGDQLLQAAARLLGGNIRDVDLPGRTGGTEFGILLPEQRLAGAMVVARRLSEVLSEASVKIGEAECQFQVTCGVAEYEGEGSGSELFHQALSLLDQARKAGERIGSQETTTEG